MFNVDGHEGAVNALAFSLDGKQFRARTGVLKNRAPFTWDAPTGKPAYELAGHVDVVT